MHTLLTVLHTFHMELVRRISLNINTSYPWWLLLFVSSLECLTSSDNVNKNFIFVTVRPWRVNIALVRKCGPQWVKKFLWSQDPGFQDPRFQDPDSFLSLIPKISLMPRSRIPRSKIPDSDHRCSMSWVTRNDGSSSWVISIVFWGNEYEKGEINVVSDSTSYTTETLNEKINSAV